MGVCGLRGKQKNVFLTESALQKVSNRFPLGPCHRKVQHDVSRSCVGIRYCTIYPSRCNSFTHDTAQREQKCPRGMPLLERGRPRWWSVGWACAHLGQQAHAPSATCSPLRHLEGLAVRYHSVKQTCTRQNLNYLECEVNSVTCLVHLLLPLVPPPMLGWNSSTATAAASLFAKAR